MYHLSLLRSITNKKNLNSLHESKKKNSFPTKYVSIRESTSIAKRAPPSATLTAVQNSTSTPIIPVIKSFRASLRYFYFFFFFLPRLSDFSATRHWGMEGEGSNYPRGMIYRRNKSH